MDDKDSKFEEANRSNQIFAHLLDNIQEQICGAGSRPGSAASTQGGGNNAEAMIGAVRQSLGAAPISSHVSLSSLLLLQPEKSLGSFHRESGMSYVLISLQKSAHFEQNIEEFGWCCRCCWPREGHATATAHPTEAWQALCCSSAP